MSKVIRVIGALVMAILSVSVPVLLGCSLAAPWSAYISLLLGIGTMGEVAVVCILVYFEAEDE